MKIKLGDIRALIREIAQREQRELDEGFMNTARAAIVAALLASKAGASENPDNFAPLAQQQDENDDPIIVTLEDDNGTQHVFEIALELTVDGVNYAILELKDPGTKPEESLYIFTVTVDENGENVYDEVQDETTWERVRQAADEIFNSDD